MTIKKLFENAYFRVFFAYILYPGVVGLFLGFIIIGFEQLGNTINSTEIFKNYGTYGLIFSVFIEIIRFQLSQKKDREFSFSNLFLWIIIFPLIFISSASLFNKYKADLKKETIKSIVLEKESKIDEEDENDSKFWIYTDIGKFTKGLEVKPELWNNLQNNDSIILFLNKGYLGYDIVDKIEKKPTANKSYN